jgi:hypothetical protein
MLVNSFRCISICNLTADHYNLPNRSTRIYVDTHSQLPERADSVDGSLFYVDVCLYNTTQVKTPRRERREQNAEEEDDDDDSEDDDITACEVCRRADREHVLLLCDGFVCVLY